MDSRVRLFGVVPQAGCVRARASRAPVAAAMRRRVPLSQHRDVAGGQLRSQAAGLHAGRAAYYDPVLVGGQHLLLDLAAGLEVDEAEIGEGAALAAVGDRARVLCAGHDKSGHGGHGRSVLLGVQVSVALLALELGDHGDGVVVGEHLVPVRGAHRGVDRCVVGHLEDLAVDPDLAPPVAEDPHLVGVVVVGLDAHSHALIGVVLDRADGRPVRRLRLAPVVVVGVARDQPEAVGLDYHVSALRTREAAGGPRGGRARMPPTRRGRSPRRPDGRGRAGRWAAPRTTCRTGRWRPCSRSC